VGEGGRGARPSQPIAGGGRGQGGEGGRFGQGGRAEGNRFSGERRQNNWNNNQNRFNNWTSNNFHGNWGGGYGYGGWGYNNWWGPAAWTGVSSFLGSMAGVAVSGGYGGGGYEESYSEPVYMDYGGGGGGSYEGGETIIVNGASQPAAEYAQQAETIADNYSQTSQAVATPTTPTEGTSAVPPSAAEQKAFAEDWMPLGVYAITEDATSQPTKYVQLLVSKSGAVGGELHDLTADTSTPVTGAVDPKSQRVAWKVGSSDTVMETGLYNLTQSETPLLIHDGTSKTRQVTMARIQDPNLTPTGTAQPAGAAHPVPAQPAVR